MASQLFLQLSAAMVGVWGNIPPQSKPPVKLQTVLEASQTTVASVRTARNEASRARARVSGAKAGRALRADAGVTNSYQEFVLPASQGGTQRGQNTTGDVSVTLPFDISGGIASSVRAAYADYQAAEAGVQSALNDVLLEAATAMIRIQRAQKQLSIAEEIAELARAQLEDSVQQRDAGATAPVDTVRLNSLRAQRLADARSARAELANAQFALSRILGSPKSEIDSVQLPTQLPNAGEKEELIATAKHSRPELLAIDFQLASAKAQQSATRAQLLPTLNLSLQYQRLFGEAVGFTANEQRAATISLRMPITDGGSVRAQVRQIDQDIANLLVRRNQLLVDIEASILTGLNEFRASVDRQRLSKEQAKSAEEVLAVQRVRRQEGVGTLLEVVDAESQYRQALINLAISDFDVLQARINLLYATGELPALAQGGKK